MMTDPNRTESAQQAPACGCDLCRSRAITELPLPEPTRADWLTKVRAEMARNRSTLAQDEPERVQPVRFSLAA